MIDDRSLLVVPISMSMSMGDGNPGVPTTSPPFPIPPAGPPGSGSSPPAQVPTSRPPSAVTLPPSAAPIEDIPTVKPTSSVSSRPPSTGSTPPVAPTVSEQPSLTPVPTTEDEKIVECPDNGLGLGSASDQRTTPIFLAVGYQAESTSSSVDDFVTELENELMSTAVSAIVGCKTNITGKIFPQTSEVGTWFL